MSRTYYLFSSGELKRKDNTLAFETDSARRIIPVEDIDHIYCFSEISLNNKLLEFLGKKQICMHFFDYYGNYTGSFVPREAQLSGCLVVKQVQHYLEPEKRLMLARSFIEGAIHNIRRNLEKREKDECCQKIDEYRKNLKQAETIEEIMSTEAHVRKLYYDQWENITGWEFEARTKRPPENALNAMLSFGNVMTYTLIIKEIYRTALNPTISFLHEPSERRFSLALDVAEVFKPIFVDRVIFRLTNLKKIKQKHFDSRVNFSYMTEEGRKIFVSEFEETLEKTILHRNLRRKIKYKNLVRLDLYKLIKHILEEDVYVPMKVWW
ncbi:MAG: type I-B CRISPR-associated endonuclease Cas1 [Clostridia bacterium]|nr:type I-B CRISPR-associated endonuclease Cas1 [Clostridia bacterium]